MTVGVPPADGEPYARDLVAADDGSEVLLMTWRPGATCAPHDHGVESGGVIHVVRGAVVERRYAFDGRALTIVSERRAEAPAILTIEAGVVHDMHAIGETVTVHAYAPRIQHMRVYDVARRATWIVADDHGAWLPKGGVGVVAEEPWAL